MAGDPRSCGSLGEATAPIDLRLSATTTSQGVVTRSSVSGNVPPAVRACLEQRIGRARFAAPVDDPPRSVSAELRLVPSEPPSSATAEATEGPPPRGVPGSPIEGGSATSIMGGSATSIMGGSATSIMGPDGVAIMGPPGQAIRAD